MVFKLLSWVRLREIESVLLFGIVLCVLNVKFISVVFIWVGLIWVLIDWLVYVVLSEIVEGKEFLISWVVEVMIGVRVIVCGLIVLLWLKVSNCLIRFELW